MNTPNPLIPKGSLQAQRRGNPNVRIAVFTVVLVHAAVFGGLLMQGCRRDDVAEPQPPEEPSAPETTNAYAPPENTNFYRDYSQFINETAPPDEPVEEETNSFERSRTGGSEPFGARRVDSNLGGIVDRSRTNETRGSGSGATIGAMREHEVVRGDNYYKLARQYNVSVNGIKQANPSVEPTRLRIGQTLQIPPEQSGTESGSGLSEGDSGNAYQVRPGDTLSEIARKHGTTIQAIKDLNNLPTSRIQAGQSLKLPEPQGGKAEPNTSG